MKRTWIISVAAAAIVLVICLMLNNWKQGIWLYYQLSWVQISFLSLAGGAVGYLIAMLFRF